MLAERTIILSQEEVCEAVKTFVRTKYHEKIEKSYELATVVVPEEGGSVHFRFSEAISPYIKKETHGKTQSHAQ